MINGTVESITDDLATIKMENIEKVIWPVKNLPAQTTVGSKIKLTLSTKPGAAPDQALSAKKMLNDILNVEPERDDRQL